MAAKTAPKTPPSVAKSQKNYKPNAWMQYPVNELGQWIHLLSKRAGHRCDKVKAAKDLADAQAYLDMMQAQLNHLKSQILS